MKFKRIVLYVLLICFSLSIVPVGAASAPDLNALTKRQAELKKSIEITQQNLRNKKKQKGNVEKDVAALDAKLEATLKELNLIETTLSSLENRIGETKRDLDRAVLEAGNQKELLKKRMRVMYENGNTGMLSVVLNATSFSDFISRMDFLKKIVDFDANILNKMRENSKTIALNKSKLEAEQTKKIQLKNQISDKKADVETTKQEKQEKLKELEKDLKALEAQIDRENEESAKITKQIMASQTKEKYIGGALGWPVPGYYGISSPYGYRMHPILKKKKLHAGIDINVPKGKDVVAANAGTVILAEWNGGYGNCVIIDHGGKISTLYGHNSKLLVKKGQKVQKGDVIAKVGSTGLSTGPHCHFEVRENGQPVDPMGYVTAKK